MGKKVLERIREENVTPRPRWIFFAQNGLLWALWLISAVLAAFAVAAIAFVWINASWDFREVTHGSDTARFILRMLPHVWIAALTLVLFVAYINLRKTETGYRYPVLLIIGLTLIVSIPLGMAFFFAGIGARVDQEFGRHIPLYRPLMDRQREDWTRPNRGLLTGEITNLREGVFDLLAPDGNEWEVKTAGLTDDMPLQEGEIVRVIGIPIAGTSTTLHACAIFPWEIRAAPPKMLRRRPPAPFFLMAEPSTDPDCSKLPLPIPLRVLKERIQP